MRLVALLVKLLCVDKTLLVHNCYKFAWPIILQEELGQGAEGRRGSKGRLLSCGKYIRASSSSPSRCRLTEELILISFDSHGRRKRTGGENYFKVNSCCCAGYLINGHFARVTWLGWVAGWPPLGRSGHSQYYVPWLSLKFAWIDRPDTFWWPKHLVALRPSRLVLVYCRIGLPIWSISGRFRTWPRFLHN